MKKTHMRLSGGRELIYTANQKRRKETLPIRGSSSPRTGDHGATLICLAFSAARGHHGSFPVAPVREALPASIR